ncbi:hypothetical protein [Methylosinus sp. Sm6]|uniref:hypothetical protein n=1 Tax=Methylosinus sp. Sm6 TaxID=2866948 RepID=UPI001C99F0EE|nr:hypothetical protein [Methylosinus sp. Sm6]MBY6244217.1 hypothetical protein [Methylosinus sp. Sm6]
MANIRKAQEGEATAGAAPAADAPPVGAASPAPAAAAAAEPSAPPPPEPTAAALGEDAPAGPEGFVIKVRGPEDGRWRAGIKFGPIETEIDLSEITRAQLEEIAADSYLSIRRA